MTAEKAALTAKERQAKHRAEMQAKGLKSLSVGFVDERYHKAIKELVAKINDGGFSDDLRTKTVIDTTGIDKLKEKVATHLGALHVARADADKQTKIAQQRSEEIGQHRAELKRFKKLFWRLYWRQ